ncbi:hypothetical protein FBUS_09401 [Fasciolopsis buskii]|uniref:Uncharacterized protein n=1 Tax=Fasciolopsis buskii TaxID=27845 RepID=A0A8E0S4K6_9TREM|nr:hypothetical protein FBUS_09401 [Fasciolopsis buski]
MFIVDYEHQLSDHRKLLILVKNIEPACEGNFFEDIYSSVCTYHSVLFPKLVAPNPYLRKNSRVPQDGVAAIDTRSDVCLFSNASDEQPVWVRYARQFHSSNNAWSSFQSHRLVLGVIGLCVCKTAADVLNAMENYTKQKVRHLRLTSPNDPEIEIPLGYFFVANSGTAFNNTNCRIYPRSFYCIIVSSRQLG